MAYKLRKPYTEEKRLEFIMEYNHKQGLRIRETDKYLFALEECEIIVDGRAIKDPAWESRQMVRREELFRNNFFEIPDIGWYRKKPKGYSSAVESMNTAYNMVNLLSLLPAGTLMLYTKPNFEKEEECTEEWLVEHAFYNEDMNKDEFGQLYNKFIIAWNQEEHSKLTEE